MTAAQFLQGEANMALVCGKIYNFCVIFVILNIIQMVSTVQLVKPGWRFGRCF